MRAAWVKSKTPIYDRIYGLLGFVYRFVSTATVFLHVTHLLRTLYLLEFLTVSPLSQFRGGNALVSFIQRNTRIPVLGHADGVCHMCEPCIKNITL